MMPEIIRETIGSTSYRLSGSVQDKRLVFAACDTLIALSPSAILQGAPKHIVSGGLMSTFDAGDSANSPRTPLSAELWISRCADRVICLAPALTPADAISLAQALYGEHGNAEVDPELVVDTFFRKRGALR
jgi:hypothetical protein